MSILYPHSQSHSDALNVSQTASPSRGNSYAPFSNLDSIEIWARYERELFAALKTGDDKAAHECLEHLTARFGSTNERVESLKGIYQEAVAKDEASLQKVLKGYERLLSENPSNTMIAKRRTVLLRTLGRDTEAITALTSLLDSSPTDIEAWAELSELYASLSMYPQAIFCLEEVLLAAPNAWNIHARIGELLWLSYSATSATGKTDDNRNVSLVQAAQRFCRSIELCDDYFRGYFGLKMVTDKLLEDGASRDAEGNEELPTKTAQALNQKSVAKIAEMVSRGALSIEERAIVRAEKLLAG